MATRFIPQFHQLLCQFRYLEFLYLATPLIFLHSRLRLSVTPRTMSSTPSSPAPSSGAVPDTPSKLAAGGAADDMARGLMNFLEPLLLETDEHIKNVVSSQNALSNQIDSLQEGTTSLRATDCDGKFSFILTSVSNPWTHLPTFSSLELRKFSEISKIPALAPYVQKLADSKTRIVNLNQLLDRITPRLDRIHAMAAEVQQQPKQAN